LPYAQGEALNGAENCRILMVFLRRGIGRTGILGIARKTTEYALRVANPRVADRPATGWPPEGGIIITP
jgi:hypothetical protein